MQARTLVGLVLSLVFLAGSGADAHFGERTDSLWGFVSRSDVVVIGAVAASQRFEEKGHTTLPGAVRLRVEEVLRGEAPSGDVGILVDGIHQPRYAEGERVLVFAGRRDGLLRSLQSRSEKVALDGVEDPAIDAVRRYAAIAAEPDAAKRLEALTAMTLELLQSPVPRLHQDAVFDLSRTALLDDRLTDARVGALARIALGASTPLVVREGIAHKLGVLAERGHESALDPLRRLAVAPGNPAVRVAALHALRRAARPEARPELVAALGADDPHVRRAAIEALAALGDAPAIAAVAGRTDDPDPRVRFEAIRALVRLGSSEANAVLARLRERDDPDLRRALELAADETSPRRRR